MVAAEAVPVALDGTVADRCQVPDGLIDCGVARPVDAFPSHEVLLLSVPEKRLTGARQGDREVEWEVFRPEIMRIA